ncbi:hypothetical protein [Blastococcus montanus]|uniref:hypothetical protein n=1 Tax=Blastococcus montanus TaxID=3144973 RepID=UPI003207D13D
MSDPPSEPARSAPADAATDRPPRRPPPRPGWRPAPPPPVAPAGPAGRPGTLRASTWLWLGSVAAGVVGLVSAVVNAGAIRARVSDAALATDPALAPGVLDAGVTATIDAVLGTSGALVVVAAVSLVLVRRPTPGMRWVLTVAGVLTLALLPLVLSLVAGGSVVDEVAFLAQAGLVAAALVTLWLRPSRSWLGRPGS